jgi:hypothetical protein
MRSLYLCMRAVHKRVGRPRAANRIDDTNRSALSAVRLVIARPRIAVAVQGARTFFPETAERQFVIALNNYAALVLAAPLASAMAREAPGVSLDVSWEPAPNYLIRDRDSI